MRFLAALLLSLHLLIPAGAQQATAPGSFASSDFNTEHCLLYYGGTWKSHQAAFQLKLGPDARYELLSSPAPGQPQITAPTPLQDSGTVSYEIDPKPEEQPFAQAYALIPTGVRPVQQAPNALDLAPAKGIPMGPSMWLHLRSEATGRVRTFQISAVSYRDGLVVQPKVLLLRDTTPGAPRNPVLLSANPWELFRELHVAVRDQAAVPGVNLSPAMLTGNWAAANEQNAPRRRASGGLVIDQDAKTAVADMSSQEVLDQRLLPCVCKKVGNLELNDRGIPTITWFSVRGTARVVIGNSTVDRHVDQPYSGSNNQDTLAAFAIKPGVSPQNRNALVLNRALLLQGACASQCSYVSSSPVEANNPNLGSRQ